MCDGRGVGVHLYRKDWADENEDEEVDECEEGNTVLKRIHVAKC